MNLMFLKSLDNMYFVSLVMYDICVMIYAFSIII